MFLVPATASQIGYLFGNFLIIYLIIYLFVLGRRRRISNEQKYPIRMGIAALLVGFAVAFSNTTANSDFGWIFGLGISACFLAYLLSWVETFSIFERFNSGMINNLLYVATFFAILTGGSFVMATMHANASAKDDFINGLRRGLSNNPFSETMSAIIDETPNLYEKFRPVIALQNQEQIGTFTQSTIGQILNEYLRRLTDDEISEVLNLQSKMLVAAHAEGPNMCVKLMNGQSGGAPRTAALREAISRYSVTTARFIRQTKLTTATVKPKPSDAQAGPIFAAVGQDLISEFQRTKDEGTQCLIEAQLRARVRTLAVDKQAIVARYLLLP